MERIYRNLMAVSILTIVFAFVTPTAQGDVKALCVPWNAQGPDEPHCTYSGAEITLKGIARGNATEYAWDFGDGQSTGWLPITNSYNLGVNHVYTGPVGKLFYATLSVRDASSNTNSDVYSTRIYESSDLSNPAHLDVRRFMAVDKALWYLHTTMVRATYGGGSPGFGQPYGYWNDPGGYPLAATGAALNAFHLAVHRPNADYDADPYVETVRRALNYLLYNTYSIGIGPQPAGDPDTNHNGIGLVAYNGNYNCQTYIGGICMVALASSKAPTMVAPVGNADVYGRKLADIMQDMVDFFAWGQVDSGSGQGGWRYGSNYSSSDMSTTQWPPLAMLVAEGFDWTIQVPAFVKTELVKFVDRVQTTAKNDDNGGFGYTDPGMWTNLTKAGIGLICHCLLETPVNDPRVESAIGWIYRHWNDTGTSWDDTKLFGNSYGMYAVMKGFDVWMSSISRVTEYDYNAGHQTANSFNWFYTPAGQSNKGLGTYLIESQQADGSWDDNVGSNPVYDAFATGWCTSVLLTVRYIPPVARICDCGEQKYLPNQAIHLDGSCSSHPDPIRKIVKYEWDFYYDGSFHTDAVGVTVTKLDGYPAPGLYPVALRVTDDNPDPQTDIYVCEVFIPWICPHAFAHPVPEGEYQGWVGTPLVLDGSRSWDPDNNIVAYDWDLDNDGFYGAEDPDCFGEPSDGVGKIVSWTWDEKGNYTISLRVTDADGCDDFDSTTVTIGNHAPIACCDGPYYAMPGQIITLDGRCSFDIDPGDYVAVFSWDLDDDGTFNDSDLPRPPYHMDPCAVEGEEYTVKMKVADSYGEWSETAYCVVRVAKGNILQLDTRTGDEPLYIRPHDCALIDMDALRLRQYVFGCQAVLNFSSTYFISELSGPNSPQIAAGGGVWDELIYRMWTIQGDLDVAVGVDLNASLGTNEDGTVAKFGLWSNGTEGITKMVFRPDTPPDFPCHGTSSTFFADANAQEVYPYKIDSQDIVIDGTPPCIAITEVSQNGRDLLSDVNAVQGKIKIVVEANDILSGLVAEPNVTFGDKIAKFIGELPGGSVCGRTFVYEIEIGPCMPNGKMPVKACAWDKAGNSACDERAIKVNKNQITGSVELEDLNPPAGDLKRRVVFVATGNWKKKIVADVNFPAGSTKGTYVLKDVPDNVTALSAKTVWNLRRKLTGLMPDECQQLVADFICETGKLLGGDLNFIRPDDNVINILDYAMFKWSWSNHNLAGDIDGDGLVTLKDFVILRKNFFKKGNPE